MKYRIAYFLATSRVFQYLVLSLLLCLTVLLLSIDLAAFSLTTLNIISIIVLLVIIFIEVNYLVNIQKFEDFLLAKDLDDIDE